MFEPAVQLGPGHFVPLFHMPRLALPLDTVKVLAGVPSPTDSVPIKR